MQLTHKTTDLVMVIVVALACLFAAANAMGSDAGPTDTATEQPADAPEAADAPKVPANADKAITAEDAGDKAKVSDTDAPEATAPDNPSEMVGGLVGALKAGRWLAAAGFMLLLIGWGGRKIVGWIAKDWAKTKTGGKVLGAGTAFAVTLGGGLALGAGFSLDLILGALTMAGAAAGFWSLSPDKAKAKLR